MAGITTVQITPVPSVANMVGVTRVLRGRKVTNVVGDSSLPEAQERALQYGYASRCLELLQTEITDKQLFTLDGTE